MNEEKEISLSLSLSTSNRIATRRSRKNASRTIKFSRDGKVTNGRKRKRGSILRMNRVQQRPSGEREEAGRKDKGRSDEGVYPILAGVAAGCRAQEGAGGSLIGSLRTGIDRKEGGGRRLAANMGSARLTRP